MEENIKESIVDYCYNEMKINNLALIFDVETIGISGYINCVKDMLTGRAMCTFDAKPSAAFQNYVNNCAYITQYADDEEECMKEYLSIMLDSFCSEIYSILLKDTIEIRDRIEYETKCNTDMAINIIRDAREKLRENFKIYTHHRQTIYTLFSPSVDEVYDLIKWELSFNSLETLFAEKLANFVMRYKCCCVGVK